MIFYDQNGITVRPSTIEDVEYLKDKLKKSDVDEVWTSHRHTPEEALKLSLERSFMCLTVDDNGEPVAMFGINPETILGNRAVIWFLSSEKLKYMKIRFLRHCKHFVNIFLNQYGYLYNFVDRRNVDTINWLEFIGAKFGPTIMINEHPFVYFSFEAQP